MKCEWCGNECENFLGHPNTNQVYCSQDCLKSSIYGSEVETILLSEEGYNHIVDMIEHPAKPTQKLIDLMRKRNG